MIDETDDGVAEEIQDDDAPAWVREGTEEDDFAVDGEDVSKAEQMVGNSDCIEPVDKVEMEITQVKLDKYTPNDQTEWKVAKLEVWLVIGSKGTDGKGKYKNKHFFPRIVFAVNRAAGIYDFSVNAKGKPSTYWLPGGNAFGDYNAFLAALGLPTSPAPKNDAAFRSSLVGQKLLVNIKKDRKQAKDKDGEYKRVDEYENVLEYVPRGSVKAQAPEQVEAAAS
jgi:hypothetical protein